MLDVQSLIGEVAAKHGIRLEPNDPAFALVTLNQLVLEETIAKLIDNVSSVLTQFAGSLDKTEHRAGAILARELKQIVATFRSDLAARKDVDPTMGELVTGPNRLHRRLPAHPGLAIGGLIAGIFFVLGCAVGTLIGMIHN